MAESDDVAGMVEAAADAMEAAEFGYHMELTRLVDGVSEYTFTIQGDPEPHIFEDRDEGYALIAERKRRAQGTSALASLGLPLETLAALKAGRSVVVPVEPTPEMLEAAATSPDDDDWYGAMAKAYRAMIAARPQPTGGSNG